MGTDITMVVDSSQIELDSKLFADWSARLQTLWDSHTAVLDGLESHETFGTHLPAALSGHYRAYQNQGRAPIFQLLVQFPGRSARRVFERVSARLQYAAATYDAADDAVRDLISRLP